MNKFIGIIIAMMVGTTVVFGQSASNVIDEVLF